jgi:uncharacterized protein YbjT (DUF2867 family)
MQIMVIGATGEIGNAVTRAALERGHDVTAFVRSPEKLGSLRDRVRVVVGDLADADAVAAAVAGHDAVVSALGSSPDASQLDVPATAMRHIVAGMRAGGSAGWSASPDRRDALRDAHLEWRCACRHGRAGRGRRLGSARALRLTAALRSRHRIPVADWQESAP